MSEILTRTRRQAAISALISQGLVSSQTQLRTMLEEEGISITQPTLSKDLAEIGAVRVRSSTGGLVYTLADDSGIPGATLDKLVVDMLVSATASGNQVVVRTPPGGAQYFAVGLDRAGWDSVLGCVAGDDTVIIVTTDALASNRVVSQLMAFAPNGRSNQ
jgi:transcriptional regulator of arginine metabolism